MKKIDPFNFKYLNMHGPRVDSVLPVKSLAMFGPNGDFHPQGLYSNVIFGRQGDRMRNEQPSRIDLGTKVFQPAFFDLLKLVHRLSTQIMLGEAYATWDPKEKNFVKADLMTGQTGMAFYLKYFPQQVFKTTDSKVRDERLDLLKKYRSNALTDRVYVVPAGIRDLEVSEDGQPIEDDLNPLYKRIIAASKSVNPDLEDINPEILDGARHSIQRALNDVYQYWFNLLNGKQGLLQGKFASRRVFESTRNILSAMDPGVAELGDPRTKGVRKTMVGLRQYVRSIPRLVISNFERGPLKDLLESAHHEAPVIDRKTLKRKSKRLKPKTADQWGTRDGLNTVISILEVEHLVHKPVLIDGDYALLIYQDDSYFRLLNSIEELPKDRDRAKVRPVSWLELIYLHTYDLEGRTINFNTRYPVTGTGSIYANEPYIKTTIVGTELTQLDDDWNPTNATVYEFPNTLDNGPLFNTMSVHPSALPGLGGDHDGDKTSMVSVTSREAVAEGKERLNSVSTYLSPDGDLTFPLTDGNIDLILHNLTGF